MPGAIPERVRWAVDTLEVEPGDRILEIGSGSGVAISLVCERLVDGTIRAIERSPVQVARARERNREHVVSGKASIRKASLEALEAGDELYNKIFAINVNLFWVRPANEELDLLRGLLTPNGTLSLFYETPGAGKAGAIAEKVVRSLSERGFSGAGVLNAWPGMVCVRASGGAG